MPGDKVPSKLNALCKLCGSSRMISDSLKLKDDFELLKMMEYTNSAQMFQSTLKSRQVAVKIIRLYVPLRDEEPLTVSTQPLLFVSITFVTSRTEVLQRGRGLETPPPPEYYPAPRCNVARTQGLPNLGMGRSREYQHLSRAWGKQRSQPPGARES